LRCNGTIHTHWKLNAAWAAGQGVASTPDRWWNGPGRCAPVIRGVVW
jgi:hypothetical protein